MKSKCIFALAVTFACVVSGQSSQTVPSSLLLQSHRPAFEFTMLLTETAVPSGLELREIDHVRPLEKPDFNIDRAARTPPEALIKAFNARQSDYRATWMNGVLVIRPTQGVARYLDQEFLPDPIAVTGVMDAGRYVFASLDPTLLKGARLGSAFGDSAERGDDIPISLDSSGGPRVIDRLNQIVRQAAPRTWYVLTREVQGEVRITRFGFMWPGGGSVGRNIPIS